MKKNFKLKIAIVSGKGGVGKSMISSAFSMLFSEKFKVVAVDCDVDAPNLSIWLNEIKGWEKVKKISISQKAIINYKKCKGCGLCAKNCPFFAIEMINKKPKINPFLCEGCGTCQIICPQKAIKLKSVKNGEIRIKKTKYGFPLVVGHLFPGETGSGKIVSEIRKEAEKFPFQIQILDSSPGTGCPVIASLRETDFAILVTEPTPSAFSDLKRILKLVKFFKLPFRIIINKADLNKKISNKIKKKFKGKILGEVSFDKNIFKAISNLKPILETNLKAKEEIKKIYQNLIKTIL